MVFAFLLFYVARMLCEWHGQDQLQVFPGLWFGLGCGMVEDAIAGLFFLLARAFKIFWFFLFGRAPEGPRLPLYLPAGGCRCNRSRVLVKFL